MNKMLQLLQNIYKRLSSYVPEALPVGMTAYNAWADEIADLIGPIADRDSLKFGVASEVIRLGPNTTRASKQYFAKRILAGATKQIAGAAMREIKDRHDAAQKAAMEAQKQAEATAQAGTSACQTASTN